MKEKTCCIIGNKVIPEADKERIIRNTRGVIYYLWDIGIRFFGVTDEPGFGALATDLLFSMKRKHRDLKIILVKSFPDDISQLSVEQQKNYNRRLSKYDKRVCMFPAPSSDANIKRDRHLLSGSSYCLCYYTSDADEVAKSLQYAPTVGAKLINVV